MKTTAVGTVRRPLTLEIFWNECPPEPLGYGGPRSFVPSAVLYGDNYLETTPRLQVGWLDGLNYVVVEAVALGLNPFSLASPPELVSN